MSTIRARAKAAVVGAFVADAASMPLHWIYDAGKIAGLLSKAGRTEPEFYDPPSCPFYTYSAGASSPYGDEILPLLRYVAREGEFNAGGFAEESVSFLRSYKGRLNHVGKLFLEARESGKTLEDSAVEDSQAHGIIKVPILVARYAGHPDLLKKVEEAVGVHQKSAESVAASLAVAKVLEKVVLGETVKSAVDWAMTPEAGLGEREQHYIAEAASAAYPSSSAIKDFGWSCALPGSFTGSIYTAAHASSYVEGVRSSLLAGGDQCSRNIVIGALLAAEGGLETVPEEWRAKAAVYPEVEALADALVARLQ